MPHLFFMAVIDDHRLMDFCTDYFLKFYR